MSHLNSMKQSNPTLAIVEERTSIPMDSRNKISSTSHESEKHPVHLDPEKILAKIICKCNKAPKVAAQTQELVQEEVNRLMVEKEDIIRENFEKQLQKEIETLSNKFDEALRNEQIRSSSVLCEVRKEGQEKIKALKTQLECKNLAALMYTMCTERKKCKMEKLRIVDEYSNCMYVLEELLKEAQSLILDLSRGYKTAARVDQEWRDKTKKIVKEFQAFVCNFAGGTPEMNQYLFDLPKLLKTEAPIEDDPTENPCACEEQAELEPVNDAEQKKHWWERMNDDDRPFVIFGDMADFKPPQRREVLKSIKYAKSAPPKWKDYVFNETLMTSGCDNMDKIKNEYPKLFRTLDKWECRAEPNHSPSDMQKHNMLRDTSLDTRGAAMGSILRIITGSAVSSPNTALLAAKDSMEIVSITRPRTKRNDSLSYTEKVLFNVGDRKISLMVGNNMEEKEEDELKSKESKADASSDDVRNSQVIDEDDKARSHTTLEILHHDSLEMIQGHVPDKDHKISYEKICPTVKCKRMKKDSFMRSLPPYMRTTPYEHAEQSFDGYEPCSPEQIAILKRRLEEKQKRYISNKLEEEDPLSEWTPKVEGVACQTSDASLYNLPECTCRDPAPTPVSETCGVFKVDELLPVKQTLDEIKRQCFYDSNIEFNRFKLLGQNTSKTSSCFTKPEVRKKDFTKSRLEEIKKILHRYPSLCDIFQASTKC